MLELYWIRLMLLIGTDVCAEESNEDMLRELVNRLNELEKILSN